MVGYGLSRVTILQFHIRKDADANEDCDPY